MTRLLQLSILTLVTFLASGTAAQAPSVEAEEPALRGEVADPAFDGGDPVVLVIHGGAGTIRRTDLDANREASIRASLEEALQAGYAEIQAGKPALDVVEAAIVVLEDDLQFNAGRGGVFASDTTVRHDASIMDGATGMAGASANTMHVKHPIRLARAVMEASPHVLMADEGAEEFAKEQRLELVENEYFHTERRRRSLEAVQERERNEQGKADPPEPWQIHGTVGVVALDTEGHLAAGTSTGGLTNKRWGRIGDSPIVGAGTFASDETAGVSGTGHGEFFIRLSIARDVHSRMVYLGESVEEAAHAVIHESLTGANGTGGVIALDRNGNVATPFNTEGMYRAVITRSGEISTAIYDDEEFWGE